MKRNLIGEKKMKSLRKKVKVEEIKEKMERYMGDERVERELMRLEGREKRRIEKGMKVEKKMIRYEEKLIGKEVG